MPNTVPTINIADMAISVPASYGVICLILLRL